MSNSVKSESKIEKRMNTSGNANLITQKETNKDVQFKDNRQTPLIQAQFQEMADSFIENKLSNSSIIQKHGNNTGLPDNLKSGMEGMTGHSLDHVKVHYNSSEPAAVQAHAYAQGSDIHLAPGQSQHLPHELGHVVQQMEGRVNPTTSVGGMPVNDSPSLESEATKMGEQALQSKAIQRHEKDEKFED